MNIRCRMQIKAMKQRLKPPIMAVIRADNGKFDRIVFIYTDHWNEARAQYGDRLNELL